MAGNGVWARRIVRFLVAVALVAGPGVDASGAVGQAAGPAAADHQQAVPSADHQRAVPSADSQPASPAADHQPASPAADQQPAGPAAADQRAATPATAGPAPPTVPVVYVAPEPPPTPGPLGPAVEPDPPQPPAGAGAVAPGAAYAWPLLPPPAVLTPFDEPDFRFGRGHRGVDLAGTAGQPVLAAADGVVVHAGLLAGRGVVSVLHPDGLRTTYEPVTASVRSGAPVRRGAVLGTLDAGHPGCPGACLHWGVRRDRWDYLDPLVLLRPPHVRLLPTPEPWPL